MTQDPPKSDDSDEPEGELIQPRSMVKKVRKVTGNLGELVGMSEGKLASKQTDFRWAMDRDLDRLSSILTAKWDDDARRMEANSDFRTIVLNLRSRAEAQGYNLLREVSDLFLAYLAHVPAGEQKRNAMENYLNALVVISKKNLHGSGGAIGEAMVADLTTLNRKSSVPT